MCDEWQDYVVFEQWAIEAGALDKPGLTIDRIDVDGNYEPSNCRWITIAEQQRNRRNNHYETFDGKTMIIADWASEYHIPARLLQERLSYGWEFERALTTPVRPHKPYQYSKSKNKDSLQKVS